MWHGIISLCLLPEQMNLFICFLFPALPVSLFWASSSSSYQQDSILSHSSKTTDTNRQTIILTFAELLISINPWQQYHPTLSHFLMASRHYLFFPISTLQLKTRFYLWAFPLSSKLCTPTVSSVSKGWSNPTLFQNSAVCRLETSPCSASHPKSLLLFPEALP